jgi:peptidoglycan/LPS O-acetylase OafA/YrhL
MSSTIGQFRTGMGHSLVAERRRDEDSPLNHRDYLVLGLAAVVSPIVMVASLVGGHFGPAALAFVVLVIAVTLIFIGANKDMERRRKRRR